MENIKVDSQAIYMSRRAAYVLHLKRHRGYSQPMITEKKIIARTVGRNPENPKSRKAGLPTEQMLEPTQHGLIGTLTTTTKDNLVVEIIYTARLRRLTPREYWRAMNFKDDDFEKAAAITNETNLYKQAGNSIVKNVLVAIFGGLIPGKEDDYTRKNDNAGFAHSGNDSGNIL